MTIERYMVPGEMEPVSHYCHVVRSGRLLWISGMVGVASDGSIPEDTVEQFRIALDTIGRCLHHAGGGPEQVVKVQVFMTDISERALINPVRVAWFGTHRPASTLVEVPALVDPRMKVEIEAVACLDGPAGRQRDTGEGARAMPIERYMVPGMREPVSHFCHVVKAGGVIWLSGMTGVAADGSIPADTLEQFRLAMASLDKALRHAGGRPEQIVKVQVFMTDISERPLINPLREAYFGMHRPASTLVEVSGLVDPRMTVEIEAMAYVDD